MTVAIVLANRFERVDIGLLLPVVKYWPERSAAPE